MATSSRGTASLGRLAGTAAATVLSLAGTTWLVLAVNGTRVDRDPQRHYASLPGDAAAVARQMPTAVAQLRRTPIDADAFNLVYVATAKRDGAQSASAMAAAAILARYGWRSAAAQQNLIEDAAYRADYATVLDRVDALMRRNKRRPQMAQVLAVLEKDPKLQPRVVERLLGHPNWRQDYLWRIGTSADPALLDARVRTLLTLLDRGDTLSREEVSRSLQALLAGDRVRSANRLWRRVSGTAGAANLIYDPTFAVVAREGARPAFGIPYEWALEAGAGYSATVQNAEWPLRIEWSGAGAGLPVFARQVIAMDAPAPAFTLELKAENPEQVRSNLEFTLSCGGQEVPFVPIGIRGTTLTYTLTGNVPQCLAPVFSIMGRSSGAGAQAIRISTFRLTARQG